MVTTPQRPKPRISFDSPQFVLSCLGLPFRERTLSEANADIRRQVKDMTLDELRALATKCVEKSNLKEPAEIMRTYEAILTTLEKYRERAQSEYRCTQRVA